MIAITFAIPTESSLLVSRLKNKRRVSSQGSDIVFGEINSQPITIFHTGVGRKICEERFANFVCEQNPAVLVSSGFAGAVRPGLEAGDLFCAENFSQEELLATARRRVAGVRWHVGKLFTSPSVVDSEIDRNRAANAQGADAVDMETEVIARICAQNEIPMLSLRVISDTPREPFPAPPSLLFDIERQRTNVMGVAAYFLIRPIALLQMFHFIRQISRARKNLTEALTNILDDSLGSAA